MRKKGISIIKAIFFFVVLGIISVLIVMTTLFNTREREWYSKNVQIFKVTYITQKKALIKDMVNNVISFVDSQKNDREKTIRKNVKERTYEGYTILSAIYNKYHGKLSDNKIKALSIDVLRSIRFAEGRGYYFIDDLQGITWLSPAKPELEGKNVLYIKDVTGKSIVGEFLKIVKEKGEGYVEYWWHTPSNPKNKYKKISYVKLFRPFGWIIGTGDYYLGNEKSLQKSILSSIANMRYSNNNYFFVLSKEGVMLANPFNTSDIGKNVLNVKDKNGKYITKEFLKVAEYPDGGYVEYIWKKPGTNKYVKKIGYAKLYKPWGWIIGTGVYMDDINKFIDTQTMLLQKSMRKNFFNILLFTIILTIIGFFLHLLIIHITKKNVNLILNSFKKAAHSHTKMDTDKILFSEFRKIAIYANKILEDITKEKEKTLSLLNAIPDIMFILDKNGVIIDYKAPEKILIMPPEKFLGKSIKDVLSGKFKEKTIEKILRNIKNVLKDGKQRHMKYELKVNGEKRLFESRFLKFEEDKVLIIEKDITDKIKMEKNLEEERKRLLVTLKSIGDGVIVTDENGHITLMNKVAEKLTGWKEKEAKKEKLDTVFKIKSEKDGKPLENPVTKVLREKRIVSLSNHTLLISKTGEERMIEDSAAPIIDKNGKIIGVVLVFRDITEKAKVMRESINMERIKNVGILAARIAHDFNNFLGSILGGVEVLSVKIEKKGIIVDEVKQDLEKMKDYIDRAKRLSKQLLTFAKGGITEIKVFSPAKLIKEVSEFSLSGTPIKLIFSIPENLWNIEGDEDQLFFAIQNILLNAKDAMPKGGNIYIALSNEEITDHPILSKGKYIKIAIKDEGMGIPKDKLDKIFEPKFTTKEEGSGFGLVSTYTIVKKHNGYIDVESEEGKGTTFYIFLPATEKEVETQKSIKTEEKETTTTKEPKKEAKILVMEDNEDLQEVFKEQLEYFGHTVEITSNGEEAIKAFKKAREKGKPFDLIIMDLTIKGGMGGKETIKHIREIDKKIPVIVSTGYAEDIIISTYKEHGFSEVLVKPFKMEKLKNLIKKLLS